jgi:FkbM family methyltransferase
MRLRILTGYNRGLWWSVGAGNHSCWLGTFDENRQRALARVMQPGDVFLDIGAHTGFFTLLGSRLVGPEGTVIAFEPLPRNVHFLRVHLATNDINNVRIVEAAVSDSAGEALFSEGPNSYTGELSRDGHIKVRTVTLDDLLANRLIPSASVVKVDVEGAELAVLRGAARLLASPHTRALLVSTHAKAIALECADLLSNAGYSVSEIPPDSQEIELLCLRSVVPHEK